MTPDPAIPPTDSQALTSSQARAQARAPGSSADAAEERVCFSNLRSARSRELVLLREQAVFAAQTEPVSAVVERFRREHPLFSISKSSLYSWRLTYNVLGIDGLVEQKIGRSGRPGAARHLTPDQILSARAAAVEYGVGGRLNIARAARRLSSDPDLAPEVQEVLHGAHAAKSYVAPSIREVLQVSPLATARLQIGPKHARLHGRWTPCSYDDVKAGQVVTADDMTANAYVWLEWPNPQGHLILRPQILAMLDVGSLAWTNLRAVFRARGQYCKDDVWGLVGDFLDEYGRPKAFLFEGGTWRSNVVVGHKTGLDDESRFAGLRSLGIQLMHSRSPRSKVIECAFNQLQYASDNCRGFCGRAEMEDRPESLRQQLYDIEHGKAHPRQYLMHAREYVEHLEKVMGELNHERQDGEILRGQCPADKWDQDKPEFEQFPDSAKWLYRSAYRICTVTSNGLRITERSGKYSESYHYDNPAVLTALQGRRVAVYWNDHNPDTDAVLMSIRAGQAHRYLGLAQRVRELPRFGATQEQMHDEGARKAAAMRYAVTESRSLAPYLQRTAPRAVPVPEGARDVGQRLADARERAQETERTRVDVRREINRVDLTPDDLDAVAPRGRSDEPDTFSAEEISRLLSPDSQP